MPPAVRLLQQRYDGRPPLGSRLVDFGSAIPPASSMCLYATAFHGLLGVAVETLVSVRRRRLLPGVAAKINDGWVTAFRIRYVAGWIDDRPKIFLV